MCKLIKNRRGISIIALVVALMLLSVFAVFALWLLAGHGDVVTTFWKSQQALYIADAGIRVNSKKLQDNWSGWNNPANFPDMPFTGGVISATIADDDDGDGDTGVDSNGRLILQVTGTLDDVQRTIQVEVNYSVPALDCAVYTTGDLEIGGSATVDGQTSEFASSLPLLNEIVAKSMAKANKSNGYDSREDGNYFRGDFSGSPDSLNGVIYIDTFEDGSPADVLLNNLSTTDGNPALLIVIGHLHITSNVNFNGLIYNSGSATVETDLTGNNTINGGIISSHNTYIRGNADINYNEDNVKNAITDTLITDNPSNYIYEWHEIF